MSQRNSSPDSELDRAHDLIAGLDAIVWEADPETLAFTFVGGGLLTALGHPGRDRGHDPPALPDLIHLDDRRRVSSELRRAASSGAPFDLRYRVVAVGGQVHEVRTVGHVVRLAHPRPTRLRGVTTRAGHPADDVRFRGFVERLPAIVYLRVPAGDSGIQDRLSYVSPQVERYLGVDPQEWMDDPASWWELIHPEDRRVVRAALAEAERTGRPSLVEYRMRARDGRQVWFRDESVSIHAEDGTLARQGIMLDVTAQKEAEAALLEAETRYRALIEQSPMISYLDAVDDGGTIYISPQATETLGYTPEDFYADPGMWSKIVHPDDLAMLDAGDPLDAEYRIIARDGRLVWVHDLARLIVDEEGKPRYWQGVLIDLTSRKEAEALRADLTRERAVADRLRVEDEMKTTFLQAVSHDLRTPLAAILGLAVTLERHETTLGRAEIHDLALRIAHNARKLDRIVEDFLDLERLQRGAAVPEAERVDVGQLVREWAAGSDLLAGRRLTLDVAPVTVQADRAMVERIVENLLGNTAKHTPATAQIWVRVEPDGDGALIAVEDDGPGVPASERERIFEPFRQGSGAAPGSGVGLALVTRFAALHGGRAWVEERSGGGASFRITLAGAPPLTDPERDQPPERDQLPEGTGSSTAGDNQA